jgi:osmotically inducible protein OsmC
VAEFHPFWFWRTEEEMKINRSGSAVWSGGLKDGKGAISTQSGALDAHPYGFAMRFEGVPGTNPEELIAAAHAGCFTMALSAKLIAREVNKAGLVDILGQDGVRQAARFLTQLRRALDEGDRS